MMIRRSKDEKSIDIDDSVSGTCVDARCFFYRICNTALCRSITYPMMAVISLLGT